MHSNQCHSIKSRKYPNSRCTYLCINGTQFCGRHLRMKNQVLYNCNTCIPNDNIGTIKNDDFNYDYIIRSSSFPYVMVDQLILIKSLTYYGLPIPKRLLKDGFIYESNRDLYDKLIGFLKTQDVYSESIDKISTIQKIVRGYFSRRRNRCCNNECLLTLESIHSIDEKYYIQFIDGSQQYGFDMRFLYKHMVIDGKRFNPYIPGSTFSDTSILKIEDKLDYCKYRGIDLKIIPKLESLTETQRFELKVNGIFQKIDQLDYLTQCSWFLELDVPALKQLYIQLEDIWNYRAQLPVLRKKEIISGPKLFNISPTAINNYPNSDPSKKIIQSLLLTIFDRLLSEGKTIDDKKLGAMFILSALVIVSIPAADSFPYLVQSF